MVTQNYICDECRREFTVRFLWLKPREVACPHCGSKKVSEAVQSRCGCAGSGKGGRGSFFT